MIQITKNFDTNEFERSETATKRGIINQINSFEIRSAIFALAENVLQPLRDAWGKPLKINSGFRCPALNSLVGGVPTSQHTKGEAADIATGDPETSYELAKVAMDLDLPFDQMILYPTFIHFSHKLNGKQRGQILYNRRYYGKKL